MAKGGFRVKKQILEYVQERGNVSFAELMRLGGDAAKGDQALCLEEYPNLIMWAGMSQPFIKAIEELLEEGRLVEKPTSLLVYMADGMLLRMPLAKSKRHYKKPRWTPVVFNCPKGGIAERTQRSDSK